MCMLLHYLAKAIIVWAEASYYISSNNYYIIGLHYWVFFILNFTLFRFRKRDTSNLGCVFEPKYYCCDRCNVEYFLHIIKHLQKTHFDSNNILITFHLWHTLPKPCNV